ncbi:MAG: 5-formyltetrahydrofolate cyclo-ligase [Blastopirellula sp.]|nr:MAG: 5-formyltetrahydrofolate cyclo-ligase [Blastopirellula sp.]
MNVSQAKQQLRRSILDNRNSFPDREAASQQIMETIEESVEFKQASTVLFYLSARSEVATLDSVRIALNNEKTVVVPYCQGDELKLFHLKNEHELEIGRFKILEPRIELRNDGSRVVDPKLIDIALVPGAAFDSQGSRLGYGRGYYDRLLPNLRRDAMTIGLAFDCQMVSQVPCEKHDYRLNRIVTQTQVIDCN